MTEKKPYELVGLRSDGSVKGIEILGRQAEPDAFALAQEYADLWRSEVQVFVAPDLLDSSDDWSRHGRELIGTVEPHTSSRNKPGAVRDAIIEYLSGREDASVSQILHAVVEKLGSVPASSVRSSLNLNVGTTGTLFERTGYGRYKLGRKP